VFLKADLNKIMILKKKYSKKYAQRLFYSSEKFTEVTAQGSVTFDNYDVIITSDFVFVIRRLFQISSDIVEKDTIFARFLKDVN
jgi:hypothetical protein